jgi:cytochrome P450
VDHAGLAREPLSFARDYPHLTTPGDLIMQTVNGSQPLESIDFFSPEVLQDPHPLYRRLRRERPVMKFRQPGFERDQYIVTTHELVDRVFRDHETFSSQFNEMFVGIAGNPEAEKIYATTWPEVNTLLTADEPDHTRLRTLAQRAFMPNRIQRMQGLIAKSVRELIDNFIERGECDFVREYAIPLPLNTISDILGLPPEVHGKLYDWTFSMMRRNGQMANFEQQLHDARQVVEMKNFVRDQVEDRRRNPKDDLISDLVTANVDGHNPLDELELLSTVNMVLLGGAETTRSSLISTMARLMTNPDQLALVRSDVSLIPKAVEEVLRLDTPGTALWRIAKKEVELAGVRIPKGAIVMVRIDSANRDESVFQDADKFDINRANINAHLSFGKGIHYCIGFRLAREQVCQSIPALLTRCRDMHMIAEKSDLGMHPSVHTKCLRKLYLAFTPGTRAGA